MAVVLVGFCMQSSGGLAAEPKGPKINVKYELDRAYKLIEYNGITRAAVHLERVIAYDPTGYPDVYFSLAQIYEHKEMPQRSALLYRAYLAQGSQPELLAQAREGAARVEGAGWTPVQVAIKGVEAKVWVDGYVLGNGVEGVMVKMPPSQDTTHTVRVEAEDYEVEEHEFKVGEAAVMVEVVPVRTVYFGGVRVVADQPGVKISIVQERADSRKAPPFEYQGYGSMEQEAVAPAGVYFVTVTHQEFETWVRRVEVGAYDIQEVEAQLTKAKPPELRAGYTPPGQN